MESIFKQLYETNVNEHIEKKGMFSYLSWPYAVATLRLVDPMASWEVKRFDGLPYQKTELGVFVEVAVTAQGVTLSQIHPVLDGKNRPLLEPSAFDINTSIQRCLVKAIALTGLGLYIYAGEDLPILEADAEEAPLPAAVPRPHQVVADSGRVTPLPQPPGNDYLTAAQKRYIERLIAETGTELQKVLDYFGFSTLDTIPKSDASRVIRSLEQSRSRKEAA